MSFKNIKKILTDLKVLNGSADFHNIKRALHLQWQDPEFGFHSVHYTTKIRHFWIKMSGKCINVNAHLKPKFDV